VEVLAVYVPSGRPGESACREQCCWQSPRHGQGRAKIGRAVMSERLPGRLVASV
jgi:hypothetical protein